MVILGISGTPGTGKTRVARILAKRLGWKLVGLNRLAAKKNLYSGYDRKRKCRIVDIDGLAKEIRKMQSKNLIIESHYAHDMPCDAVVILRASPSELRKRMKAKGWPKEKIEENTEAEIMEVCRAEALEQGRKVLELDTTGRTPKSAAGEIVKKLKKKSWL